MCAPVSMGGATGNCVGGATGTVCLHPSVTMDLVAMGVANWDCGCCYLGL